MLPVITLFIALLLQFSMLILLSRCYKRCPNNRAIVRTGTGGLAVCSGSGTVVLPILHRYGIVSLEPVRVTLPGHVIASGEHSSDWQFTVGVGLTWQSIADAAPHTLDRNADEVAQFLQDTITAELSRGGQATNLNVGDVDERLRASLSTLGLELLSWGPASYDIPSREHA